MEALFGDQRPHLDMLKIIHLSPHKLYLSHLGYLDHLFKRDWNFVFISYSARDRGASFRPFSSLLNTLHLGRLGHHILDPIE